MTTRFRYQAMDNAGKVTRGHVEAATSSEARQLLRDKGLVAFEVSRRLNFDPGRIFGLFRTTKRRSSKLDVAVFTRQMATMLGSGVQIEAALAALSRQTGPRLGAECRRVRESILDGNSFAVALGASGLGLDRFYMTSIEAGERSGRHGAVLSYLADHAEARLRNRQTIFLALIYPTILIIVSVAVVIGLLVFLFPDIVRVFASRGAELPPLTRFMIGWSDFLTENFAVMGLFVLGLSGGILSALKRPEVRQLGHRLLWRSGLARRATLVEFTGTLATLTQSGVPLADALSSATATVGNETARDILQDVAREVRDGAALSRSLGLRREFDPMMVTILASGEASGSLPSMLDRYAKDQSQALQARVKTMVGLVEPVVLLCLGGVVMLLVLAILMPIVNLNALVQ